MELRVAGAQLPVTQEIETNIAAIRRGIDFAAREKAAILLTPEGSLSGYTPHFDAKRVREALEEVTRRAAEAGVGLALGTCFLEDDERCYNEIRFYDRQGNFLGFHSKTLTCGTMTEPPIGEINDYAVSPLRVFRFEGVTIGGLICNDLWANPCCTPMPDPHLTHQLAKMGAQVIFHAVNGGRDGGETSQLWWAYHEANLRARAMADGLFIVTTDNCSPSHLRCSAPSGVVNGEGKWVVATTPEGEQLFATTLNLEAHPQ